MSSTTVFPTRDAAIERLHLIVAHASQFLAGEIDYDMLIGLVGSRGADGWQIDADVFDFWDAVRRSRLSTPTGREQIRAEILDYRPWWAVEETVHELWPPVEGAEWEARWDSEPFGNGEVSAVLERCVDVDSTAIALSEQTRVVLAVDDQHIDIGVEQVGDVIAAIRAALAVRDSDLTFRTTTEEN